MLKSMIVGNKIRDARTGKNLSQAQLAQKLFISPQAVGKWERGESMPDIITLNRLAEILGVDLNYFSESFQSIDSEAAYVESLVKQSAESTSSNASHLPLGKQKKNHGWNMSSGNWVDADFSGLKNLSEKFSASNMQRCKFIGSEMSGLHLKDNNFDGCDFSSSDISSSHIQSSNLLNNLFRDCSLKDIEVSGSCIMDCDFTGADFTGAEFKSGGFQCNRMTNTVLARTSFIDMHIAEMLFDGNLEECSFDNCAFTRVTFQNSTLIHTFFKNNKNLKRVKFIDCKADRMTYEFLKIGNANLSGITLLIS